MTHTPSSKPELGPVVCKQFCISEEHYVQRTGMWVVCYGNCSFLFLKEQIKDIIIYMGVVWYSEIHSVIPARNSVQP